MFMTITRIRQKILNLEICFDLNWPFVPVKDGVLQGEYKNINKAIEAGASIIMDTKENKVIQQEMNDKLKDLVDHEEVD